MEFEPITRAEQIMSGESLEPITREEMFLAKLSGQDVTTPAPITREEMFLQKAIDSGGAGGSGGTTIKNQNKTITANGQYTADSGYTGLGTVTVAVPEEEPVLQDKQITANGTYQADSGYDGLGEVVVDVPSGAPVIQPLSVTENGTYEAPDGVDGYSPVTVAIESGGGDFPTQYRVDKVGTYGDLEAVEFFGYTMIYPCACYNAQRIDSVDFKDGLKRIMGEAFYMCTGLRELVFPSSLNYVDGRSFAYCTGLTKVTFKATTMEFFSSNAFTGCTKLLTINVPWAEGAVANAPWGATNATINYNYTGG